MFVCVSVCKRVCVCVLSLSAAHQAVVIKAAAEEKHRPLHACLNGTLISDIDAVLASEAAGSLHAHMVRVRSALRHTADTLSHQASVRNTLYELKTNPFGVEFDLENVPARLLALAKLLDDECQ